MPKVQESLRSIHIIKINNFEIKIRIDSPAIAGLGIFKYSAF